MRIRFSLPLAAAVFALAAFASAPALADCMSACLARNSCSSEFETGRMFNTRGNCSMHASSCETECKRGSGAGSVKTAKPQRKNHGAIAYDPRSRAWGMSDFSTSKEAAADSAVDYCDENGSHCKVVETIANGCGAVATGAEDVVAWGKAKTAQGAQNAAQRACQRKAKRKTCIVQLWQCYIN